MANELPLKRVKLALTVDEGTVENLRAIQATHGDPSLTQAFRRAIALQHFVDQQRAQGKDVILKKGDDLWQIYAP